MSTLVVTSRPITLAHSGYDLRVAHLCREIEGPKHLIIVPHLPPDGRRPGIEMSSIFETVETLRGDLLHSRHWARHVRLSEKDYLRRAFPQAFTAAVTRIRELLVHTRSRRVVVFGSALAEIGRAIDAPHTLLDVCDSVCLTARRQIEMSGRVVSLRRRLLERLHLIRWTEVERGLPRWFGQVTTINDADTKEILRLHGRPATNVHTIPNGVGDHFLTPLEEQTHIDRCVAFWGNLRFRPNEEALRHFLLEVYAPHLKHHGVKVRVVGEGAPAWLLDAVARDPGIELLGFVEDLRAAVRTCPVMVNPMLIGSGMKNKVLEAFAMGLTVVSTGLGIESIPQAVAGTHHLVAEKPAAFAAAVRRLLEDAQLRETMRSRANRLVHEHYRWEAIGRSWRRLIEAS